uniref:Uncharacterized protein n=1 Tax=Aegilops tauschii subsp. strangulata TaxID=200361 RepID=A0A453QMC6_AEGTS
MGPFLAGVTAANPSISFHCLPPAEHPPVEAARVSNPQLVTSWPALLENTRLEIVHGGMAMAMAFLWCGIG